MPRPGRLGRYSYIGILEFLFQFLLSLNEFSLLIQLRANNFTSILQLSDYLGPLLHRLSTTTLYITIILLRIYILCRLHDSENFHLRKTIIVNSMEENFFTLKYTERRNIKLRSVKTSTYSCTRISAKLCTVMFTMIC